MTRSNDRPRTVAFYLPQFHAIAENDQWWGEGFTEWRNVDRARPAFLAHDHPRRPRDLGAYDLTDVSVMHTQAEMARAHDVDAFCFYFYWFSGKRLLETPVDQYLADGPDYPFCLSWANENWSRRWDGKDAEVLIGQDYESGFAEDAFDALTPYLADHRYLRTRSGAAILLVHRVDHIPDPLAMTQRWRQLATERGIGELYLVAAETKPGIRPDAYGMDAVAEFPPVGSNVLSVAQLTPPRGLARDFRGRVMSYPRLARRFMRRRPAPFVRHRGVTPGWDNTARRQSRATIYAGATPEGYRHWLSRAREDEARDRGADGLVFVNAWNEWAEGAYLEPDQTHGDRYLLATRDDDGAWAGAESASVPVGRPSWPWLRSLGLAAAGSVLGAARAIREKARARAR